MTTENHNEEIARLTRRGDKDPRTHTFARLADLYRKTGDLPRALQVIEGGLKHHPHYLNARLVHAWVLRELGRPDEARQAFEHVLHIDSENLVAQAALSDLGASGAAPGEEAAPTAAPADGPASNLWLARLDADWRRVRAENGGGSGQSSESSGTDASPHELVLAKPGAEAPQAAAEKQPQEPPRRVWGRDDDDAPHPGAAPELETATLAALYMRQGLFDRAMGVYERLLARDPYNARLAGALEDARRRITEADGPKPRESGARGPIRGPALPGTPGTALKSAVEATVSGARLTPVLPAAPSSRRESDDAEPPPPPVRSRPSIRTQLGQILDGRAVEEAPESASGWAEWLDRLDHGRD